MSEQKRQLNLSFRGILHWFVEQTISNLFFGIVIILILALVAYFLSPLNVSLPLLSKPIDILIYDQCYHIGDVTRDWFCHPVPQTNPFERKFQIQNVSGVAYIRITAKHVDPNEVSSPVRIYINGEFIDFLNRYFEAETVNPKTVEIPIKSGILHIGENSILIVGGIEVNQYYENVDDFEFWDLMVRFKQP